MTAKSNVSVVVVDVAVAVAFGVSAVFDVAVVVCLLSLRSSLRCSTRAGSEFSGFFSLFVFQDELNPSGSNAMGSGCGAT